MSEADRVVTMDLHAAQIQGFFRVPVDDLYALPVLCDAVKKGIYRTLWSCRLIPDLQSRLVNTQTTSVHRLAYKLKERGATNVLVTISHGVFSEESVENIEKSPISKLIVTDSVETQPTTFTDKIEVVSVAPMIAEAIKRIQTRESISVLFPQ
ncbi:MAG: hypothetical protein VX910_09645 [Candidatus Latescibacterota bacterium]|nr:hypothetical protein [Candidatus Latescibacterota bacterium]